MILLPIACAASSITFKLFFFAILLIISKLHILPVQCTGTIALVFEVIFSSILFSSIFKSSFTSTKTGFAPRWAIAAAVAINEIALVITSSPFFIPIAHNAIINASVPEFKVKQYLVPRYSLISCSSFVFSSDKIKFPDAKTLSIIGNNSSFSFSYLCFKSIKLIFFIIKFCKTLLSF